MPTPTTYTAGGTTYGVNASGQYGGQLTNSGQNIAPTPNTTAPTTNATTSSSSQGPSYSPAVITSNAAADNLAGIQTHFNDVKTAVANQATTNAQTQATNSATAQATQTQANADKVAADKAAADKANAQAKLAAINGPITSPTEGAPITDTQGRPGVSAFDANTGAPQKTSATTASTPTATTDNGLTSENNTYQGAITQSLNDQAAAYNDYKTQVNNLKNGTFPLSGAQQALVDSTAAAFDDAVRQANLRGAALSSETGGFSNKVTQNLGQISNIDSQKAAALAKLEIGFQDEDYKMITDAYNAYTNAEKTKTDLLTSLHKDTVDQADKLRQANLEAQKTQYEEVTKPIQDIATEAAKNGADKKTIAAINASKDVSGAINAAGDTLQSATGTLGDYLQYKRDAVIAGHIPVDFQSYKQAEEDRKNKAEINKIYATENAKAQATGGANGSSATGSSTGSVSADAKDILEGRNTMYNIRQTMGRTNKAAAYMQSIRDEIRKSDPSFDFVASDAGGKSVSTGYVQKATAAINSVLPNINKVVDLSNQVSRIGVKGVDRLLQSGATQIGNEKVTNFQEAQKLLADEIGIALGAGTVSDMKLQLGFDVTDPSVKPEVFASNMGIVKDFVQNRLKGLQDLRYKSTAVGAQEADAETKVTTGLNTVKTTKPELYKAASSMYLTNNPKTGVPYTASEVLEVFPELAK